MSGTRGESVGPFPARLLAGALGLTGIMLVAMAGLAVASYRSIGSVQLRDLRIQELRGAIIHLDEVLTMSARMAVETGDRDWEGRYRRFEPRLDAAIEEAIELTAHSDGAAAAAETDAANLELVDMENRGFDLVRAGQAGQAKAILLSDTYAAQKTIYADGMIRLLQSLKGQLAADQRAKQHEALGSIITVAVCLALLLSTWFVVLRRVSSWRANQASSLDALTRAEDALRKLNDGLEQRVEDRTRALEKAQSDLMETSRRAGMAEVATGVLHNVGNVLNSVNVASSCLAESLKRSKSASLAKVVDLLREHEMDLGGFFTSDPKGKQVPVYLAQLAAHLAREQSEALNELAQLQGNIEHIKDIVRIQQGLAKSARVTELVDVAALVEDALRMELTELALQDIEVIRDLEGTSRVTLEKHKVLQILVNLVRNARHACEASDRHERRLTIRAANGDGRVRIAVCDNGIGIPEDNLTRIFSHGFTTKTDGHGFGLHSGALAAKDMGGSLTVHSDGPGRGAEFTLELPVEHGLSATSSAA